MNDYLRAVDWESLQGPYGPASDVPRLLQTLRSHDQAARGEAEEELEDHLQAQGLVGEPAAAASPYLIDLLADQDAPDRLAAYRLLRTILDCVQLYESPRPLSDVPSLGELASQRSDWWLSRSPAWRRHGGYKRPVTNACHAAAYEAVRAGIPTYLHVLRGQHRDLRLGMAYLLAHFPQDWEAISPVLAHQLSAETDRSVAAALCVAAGAAGRPTEGTMKDALHQWRGHQDAVVHRAALMGLVRVLPAPDTDLLGELADCLVVSHVPEWNFYGGSIDNAAALSLGGVSVDAVPQLADHLIKRMAVPSPGRCDFLALRLLLGLTFPEGPLPDGIGFADLSAPQQEVVRLVLQAGLLRQGPMMPRAVGECNLPYTEEGLIAWCAGRTV